MGVLYFFLEKGKKLTHWAMQLFMDHQMALSIQLEVDGFGMDGLLKALCTTVIVACFTNAVLCLFYELPD